MDNWSPSALKICTVCDLIFASTIIVGCAYVVFWMGQNGWWFALAIFIASCWSCKSYRSPQQIAADKDSK